MGKFLIGLLIGLVLVAVAFYLINGSGDNQSITGSTTKNTSDTNENAKTFVITGANLKFFMNGIESPELRVRQGDKVRIEFASTEGFHDWVLDEFNAATGKVGAGASTFVEFVADKKGTFEYYCSVGQHRANGMKGVFVVE